MAGAVWIAEGWRTSGWVCCIFTVAFGIAGFALSAGRVMRAVSFFGAAARCVTGSGGLMPLAPAMGAGLSGTVGRAPSDGGFGGGFTPLVVLGAEGGGGAPRPGFDAGGGGTKGLAPLGGAGGGGIGALEPVVILVVSFFGAMPAGGIMLAGLPGRLMRTVSRFCAGASGFAGSVMRMVSALEASSDSEGAGGSSSAIGG